MKIAAAVTLVLLLAPLPLRALDTTELLGLVAMPLAVAAASEVTGVSAADIGTIVSYLNGAAVLPTQIVEVVRYAPAALVIEESQPAFVPFVQTQIQEGVTGVRLVQVIEERFRLYDVSPQIVTAPSRTIVVDGDFIPALVTTRVTKVRNHPHGGPPGQIKKQLGLQTGAEVVHRSRTRVRVVDDDRKVAKVEKKIEKAERKAERKADKQSGNNPGKGKGPKKGKG